MSESVLLIDDDEIFVRVLARALAARGFDVRTAGTSADALAAAREHQPDHAVLDLKLGDENGLSLIPELLEIQPDLRILLLTGYASIATRGRGDQARRKRLSRQTCRRRPGRAGAARRRRRSRSVSGIGVRGAAAQAARVGTYPARARRVRGQHLRSRAAARAASPHAATKARQTPRARIRRVTRYMRCVSGNTTATSVPTPGSLDNTTSQPNRSASLFTIVSPMPWPLPRP